MVAFIDQLFWDTWFTVVFLLAISYLLYLAAALVVGGVRNPGVAVAIAAIIGFIAMVPVWLSILVIGCVMLARIVVVVRDWLSEPVYAPQHRIKVRAAR